jgi:probable addiction module antidote protein
MPTRKKPTAKKTPAKKKAAVFETADYFAMPEAQAELLADAFGTGDAAYIAHALGMVAKAKGWTALAKETGMTRVGLAKAFSDKGDPRLSTLTGTLKALNLKLTVRAA